MSVDGAMKVRLMRAATSWPILAVWVATSLLVATSATFSLLQPAWLVRRHQTSLATLGTFSFCLREDLKEEVEGSACQVYGAPSGAWQAACLLYASGCLFLLCCALVSLVCLALPTDRWRFLVSLAVGHAQAAGVASLLAAVLVFPMGFGAPIVRQICGDNSSAFHSGSCSLGWGYVLAIVSSVVAIYCPVLARLTTYHSYEPVYWTLPPL